MSLTIDPEFRSLIPPLSAEELAGLEESIKAEGCRDASMTTLTAPTWQQFRETFDEVALAIEDDWFKDHGADMFGEYDLDSAKVGKPSDAMALAAVVFLRHKLAFEHHCRMRMEAWLERHPGRWEEVQPC